MPKAATTSRKPLVSVVRPVQPRHPSTGDAGTGRPPTERPERTTGRPRAEGGRNLLDRTESSSSSAPRDSGAGRQPEQLSQSEVLLASSESSTGGGSSHDSGTSGGGDSIGRGGDGANKPTGDGRDKSRGDFFDDLAEHTEKPPPVPGEPQGSAAEVQGGDAPQPLDSREVTRLVAEAIDSNRYFKHLPDQVRDYLKQRISALPYADQLEVIQHIEELTRSPKLRRFIRRLSRGKEEEVAQRVEEITKRLNNWIDQEMRRAQAARKIPVKEGDPGSELATGPDRKMMATEKPTILDDRSPEEREHLKATADKGLYDTAMKMRQERVSEMQKRWLYRLILVEMALAAIHMTVPPER